MSLTICRGAGLGFVPGRAFPDDPMGLGGVAEPAAFLLASLGAPEIPVDQEEVLDFPEGVGRELADFGGPRVGDRHGQDLCSDLPGSVGRPIFFGLARVAEWQTQWTQNPPGATPCEFDSRLGHFLTIE